MCTPSEIFSYRISCIPRLEHEQSFPFFSCFTPTVVQYKYRSQIHEHNFVEVSWHNLQSSKTWGFRVQCLHYKPVSNHFFSGGGGGGVVTVKSKAENFCSNNVHEFDLRTSVVIIFKFLIESMLRLRRRRCRRGSRVHCRLARILLLLLLLLALPLVAAAASPRCSRSCRRWPLGTSFITHIPTGKSLFFKCGNKQLRVLVVLNLKNIWISL